MPPFQNSPIPQASLPPLSQLPFTGLTNKYRGYLFLLLGLAACVGIGIVLLLAFVAKKDFFVAHWPWVLGGIGTLVLLGLVYIMLSFPKKGVLLRDHEISYQRGLLFFRRTSIPYNRIQHVETSQHVLEKSFGLMRLKIFTAGGSTSDLRIPGLEEERAQQMEELLMQKSNLHV